jgi:hypothetical protein
MLDQSTGSWGIPVRIISEPGGSLWILIVPPIVTLVIGLILGLCAEPARNLIKRWRANVEIYREVGAYLARFAVFRQKTVISGVGGADFDITSWQEMTRPKWPYFDYYSVREPLIFLMADNSQGAQELVGWLRAVGITYRSPTFQHPDTAVFEAFCHDVLSGYTQFCSHDSSKRRLIKVFNRYGEAKAIGFPIPRNSAA